MRRSTSSLDHALSLLVLRGSCQWTEICIREFMMTKWLEMHSWPLVRLFCSTESEMPLHVSSGLFIVTAVWLPHLWLTVSCFTSCSITSQTPTCGSVSLLAGGLTLWRRKAEAQLTGEASRNAFGWRKSWSVSVGVRETPEIKVCWMRRKYSTYSTIVSLLNWLSCSVPPPAPAHTAGKMPPQFII